VNVATFLRSYWGDVHDIAADAALVADIQTDQSLPREAARAAILMRTSQPSALQSPLAKQIAKMQRKAGQSALQAAVKQAQSVQPPPKTSRHRHNKGSPPARAQERPRAHCLFPLRIYRLGFVQTVIVTLDCSITTDCFRNQRLSPSPSGRCVSRRTYVHWHGRSGRSRNVFTTTQKPLQR